MPGPTRSPLGDDSRTRHASEAPTTTRAGADEVVYRPSGSDDENDAPTLDPTPTRSGIFGASPATPLPDRPSSATARAQPPHSFPPDASSSPRGVRPDPAPPSIRV